MEDDDAQTLTIHIPTGTSSAVEAFVADLWEGTGSFIEISMPPIGVELEEWSRRSHFIADGRAPAPG